MDDKKHGLGRIALTRRVAGGVEPDEPFSATDAQLRALSERYKTPALDLARVRIPLELLELLPRETAEAHGLLPVRAKDDALLVAMIEPDNASALDELSFVTGKRIVPYVAPAADVRNMISSAYLALRRGEKVYDGPKFSAPALEASEPLSSSGSADVPDPHFDIPLASAPSASRAERERPAADPPPRRPAAAQGVSGQELAPLGREPNPTQAKASPEVSAPPPTRQSPAMSALASSALEIPDLVVGEVTIREAQRQEPSAFQAMDFEDETADEKVSLSLSFDNLPAASGSAGASSTSMQLAAAAPKKTAPNGHSVLVVEDDVEIATLLRRLLEAEGYRVVVAPDGEAGLSELKRSAPSVLLLDAMLPKVHGFEIVRRVRASRRLVNLPIVILSAVHRGWGYAEDLRLASGVQHYVEKPFEAQHLLRAVAQAVQPEAGAVKLDPHAVQQLEAGVAALNAGDLETAQQRLEKALGIDPAAHQVHFQLGVVYGKRGRVFEAIGALERAHALAPRVFVSARSLAVLYEKVGFSNKSKEMWARALALAPDDPTKESIRQHLGRLH